jgi:hypothetical protein
MGWSINFPKYNKSGVIGDGAAFVVFWINPVFFFNRIY